jgi:acyl-coenzyme A thioesterase PaaI-like protein
MLVTIDLPAEARAACDHLRKINHPECFACGSAGEAGLGLDFDVEQPGCVEAMFDCPDRLQGYGGVLHGGVICLLLDAAMTNCGFSLGRAMVTGDMSVRFLHPVPTRSSIRLRAWAEVSSGPLQVVHGEVRLNDRVMARAAGRFVAKSLAKLPTGDTT